MKLQSHRYRVHKKAMKILCEICSATLGSKNAYRVHMRQHTNEIKARCKECDMGFISKLAYDRHCISKHGLSKYVCHICAKTLCDGTHLKMHIARHASQEEREKTGVKCDKCDKMFPNAKLLKEHDGNVHSNKPRKWSFCEICGKKLSISTMKGHMKMHEKRGNEVFPCHLCSEVFVYPKRLKKHLVENHPDHFPFKCDKCDKGFRLSSSLKIHLSLFHKIDGERDENDPLTCIVCNEKFANTDLLTQHQIQKHPVNIRIKIDYEKLKCDVCLLKFANSDYLSRHYQSHLNAVEHLCDVCEKEFKTLDELKLHFGEHVRENQFCCFYCGKCSYRRETLLLHQRTHTGEKPFICSQCGKGFAQRISLKTHMKIHFDKNS